jgi:uncharacterized protein YaiL (DUF2058 family)
MAKSLMDQLLKAGLVDKRKVSEVAKEKSKQQKMQRKNQVEVTDEAKVNAQQAMLEKAERDRQLNFQRDEEARHKAIIAQIKQLVETSQLPRTGAELSYNFTDGSKIKKILVTAEQQDQLSNGRISIVRFDEKYFVVPKAVAEKIRQRDASYVVVSNVKTVLEDEDDPYADYKIPDDLMW